MKALVIGANGKTGFLITKKLTNTSHTAIAFGGDPGVFSSMLFDPEQNIGAVIVGNGHDDQIDWDGMIGLLSLLFERGEAMNASQGS